MFSASLPTLTFSSFHPSLFLGTSGDRWDSEMPKCKAFYCPNFTHLTLFPFSVLLCNLFTPLFPICFPSWVSLLPPSLIDPFLPIFHFSSLCKSHHHFDSFFSLDHTVIYLYHPDPNNFCQIFTVYWAKNCARYLWTGGKVKRWVSFSHFVQEFTVQWER